MPHADRRMPPGARRRALVAVGALLSGVLLLAGCASMPDSGDVSKVGQSPRDASDPQVRVFGVQPQAGEGPKQIVEGFLEAVTSDEAKFQTARDYLAGAAKKWNPFTRTTIISGKPDLYTPRTPTNRTEPGMTIAMSTSQVAVVDKDDSFAPAAQRFRTAFHLGQYQGQWRIDDLSPGLIIEQSDFQRIYQSVGKYYFAKLGPQSGDSPQGPDTMVADPIYVRRRIDPVSASIQALLSGPSSWLSPVVTTAFPTGTRLAGPNPALDDNGRLRVQLAGLPAGLSQDVCQDMAAQLMNTVQDQSSAQVTSVEIHRSSGATAVCTLNRQQAQAYSPARLSGSGDQQYLVDAAHRMESVPSQSDSTKHVLGPFGEPQAELQTVAVSRGDEVQAAGVRVGGRSLEIAPLSAAGKVKTVLSGKADLSAPSWDGLGDLWVAGRDPVTPRLWMYDTEGHVIQVRVPGLGGDRVQSVRVAADGVRVVLLVERDGHTVLEIGRVQRTGTADHPVVSVAGLRIVAPSYEDVQAVSWAGESRLVMVGKQWKSVQQLQYVDTDGSSAFTPTLPGISTVTSVAASEDQSRPLLVADKEGVYRLPTDSYWTAISGNSTAPVYPG
ncbi:LpqB family beta-propeller domain-containing protein [Streptomyces sp. SL13]|uniref:LpqB family beta-propeller domain-containing protein n=1 Tax=Streptantibioticus silvisoli TaxID=2705255 RepID=A0AA90H7W9_9ACTN|nr:LpqB family beta-propeller domain-containing protein [Streptantibioticus silvisoli]MDI5972563.1 LpqB family beta-propeller domain-containing protein [Streptantibioticus silvisoli]